MPYIRNYFAAERGLTMHPRKFYLQHYSKGIKFLGTVIKYNRIYTNNQTVARCFGKIHYYNEACRHSSRRKAPECREADDNPKLLFGVDAAFRYVQHS